jgi:AraC-like DNA-binding protein
VDHLDLSDQGGVATLKISDRHTSFGYAINLAEVAAVDQIYDLSITNICGIMRALCGMHWSPERVHLSRGQPQNTRPYRQYFRAPIIFNGLESAIIFNSDLLRQPIATADPESRGHLIEHAHRLHDTSPPSLSSRLLAILRRNLVGGATTAAATADLFGLHERTLHRRLQAEGTSFRKLLDQVRQTVSQHYLTGTALPVSDIAMALGYSSTGAFDHAFRRWLGESPSKWREEHTATG